MDYEQGAGGVATSAAISASAGDGATESAEGFMVNVQDGGVAAAGPSDAGQGSAAEGVGDGMAVDGGEDGRAAAGAGSGGAKPKRKYRSKKSQLTSGGASGNVRAARRDRET